MNKKLKEIELENDLNKVHEFIDELVEELDEETIDFMNDNDDIVDEFRKKVS